MYITIVSPDLYKSLANLFDIPVSVEHRNLTVLIEDGKVFLLYLDLIDGLSDNLELDNIRCIKIDYYLDTLRLQFKHGRDIYSAIVGHSGIFTWVKL